MSPSVIIILAVFVGTAAFCAAVGISIAEIHSRDPVRRLARLNRNQQPAENTASLLKQELLNESLIGLQHLWQSVGISSRSISNWIEQAELPFAFHWLLFIAPIGSLLLLAAARLVHAPPIVTPIAALLGFALPFGYVVWRRKQRITRFSQQLPDALELMASSLRSGNTLQASMHVITEEMLPPISREFAMVSESVKLGIPIDQALGELARRVPNPDLQFFVTAVGMQRQCGGDLCEILDKISWLVRERFYIQGQVQALTGEGRLSGAVLMALPVLLFAAVYVLNPEYVKLLYTDPTGKKMLTAAIVLQLFGAIAIRRIINIKI